MPRSTPLLILTALVTASCTSEPVGMVSVTDFTQAPPDTELGALDIAGRIEVCAALDVGRIQNPPQSLCEIAATVRAHRAGEGTPACNDDVLDCLNRYEASQQDRCRAIAEGAWQGCAATVQNLFDCNYPRGLGVGYPELDCDRLGELTDADIAAFEATLRAVDAEPGCAPLEAACGAPASASASFAFPDAERRRSWSKVIVRGQMPSPDLGVCAVRSECAEVVSASGPEGCTPEASCDPNWLLSPSPACVVDDMPTSIALGDGQAIEIGFDGTLEGCTLEVLSTGADAEGYEVLLCDTLSDDCVAAERQTSVDGLTTFELRTL